MDPAAKGRSCPCLSLTREESEELDALLPEGMRADPGESCWLAEREAGKDTGLVWCRRRRLLPEAVGWAEVLALSHRDQSRILAVVLVTTRPDPAAGLRSGLSEARHQAQVG